MRELEELLGILEKYYPGISEKVKKIEYEDVWVGNAPLYCEEFITSANCLPYCSSFVGYCASYLPEEIIIDSIEDLDDAARAAEILHKFSYGHSWRVKEMLLKIACALMNNCKKVVYLNEGNKDFDQVIFVDDNVNEKKLEEELDKAIEYYDKGFEAEKIADECCPEKADEIADCIYGGTKFDVKRCEELFNEVIQKGKRLNTNK